MARPNQDARYLEKLRIHFSREGVMPSLEGLRLVCGFNSKTAAAKLASRLVDARYLKHSNSRRLIPNERFFERPLVGHVQAGRPRDTGQMPITLAVIDRLLVDQPENALLVPVKGDSMRDAGILPGDIAVLNRAKRAHAGDFVVALVDGEVTLKELAFERQRPVLRPHNPMFKAIYPSAEFEVLGVVEGLIRKYGRKLRPPSHTKR